MAATSLNDLYFLDAPHDVVRLGNFLGACCRLLLLLLSLSSLLGRTLPLRIYIGIVITISVVLFILVVILDADLAVVLVALRGRCSLSLSAHFSVDPLALALVLLINRDVGQLEFSTESSVVDEAEEPEGACHGEQHDETHHQSRFQIGRGLRQCLLLFGFQSSVVLLLVSGILSIPGDAFLVETRELDGLDAGETCEARNTCQLQLLRERQLRLRGALGCHSERLPEVAYIEPDSLDADVGREDSDCVDPEVRLL